MRSGQGGSGVLAQPASSALVRAAAMSAQGRAPARLGVGELEICERLMRGPRCPGAATWGRGRAAYYLRSRWAVTGAQGLVWWMARVIGEARLSMLQ